MPVHELKLYACDKYDREEHKANYYILKSNRKKDIEYIKNPIKRIHEICPGAIVIDTYNLTSEILALYVNCLTNEDYVLDHKRALVRDEDGYSIWGHSVYFKRKPEQDCVIKRTDKPRKEPPESDYDDNDDEYMGHVDL